MRRLIYFGAVTILSIARGAALGASEDEASLRYTATQFTPEAYRKEASRALVADINSLIRQLDLPEKVPMEINDFREIFIQPPYRCDSQGGFGSAISSNYTYSTPAGNVLCAVDWNDASSAAFLESVRRTYARPKNQRNNAAAYSLARNWLAAAGVDLAALERECSVDFRVQEMGDKFVPIYWVIWRQPAACIECPADFYEGGFQAAAYVRVLEPERKLLQLGVENPRYMLRQPLAVDNRDQLLQQTDDLAMRRWWYTTDAYRQAAIRLMLAEVNRVRERLGLPPGHPLDSGQLTKVKIATPFVAERTGYFATIQDPDYTYSAVFSNQISCIRKTLNDCDDRAWLASLKRRAVLPMSLVDTNSAYKAARRILEGLSVDVAALERDFELDVGPWELGQQFVPLYDVVWCRQRGKRQEIGAMVRLVLPSGELKYVQVSRADYIKRPPLVVPQKVELPVEAKPAEKGRQPMTMQSD